MSVEQQPTTGNRDLRCPYCGAEIEAILEYTSSSYSEHRDHNGYECESYTCDAQWDNRGRALRGPKAATEGAQHG